jgi:hypothetical protein
MTAASHAAGLGFDSRSLYTYILLALLLGGLGPILYVLCHGFDSRSLYSPFLLVQCGKVGERGRNEVLAREGNENFPAQFGELCLAELKTFTSLLS